MVVTYIYPHSGHWPLNGRVRIVGTGPYADRFSSQSTTQLFPSISAGRVQNRSPEPICAYTCLSQVTNCSKQGVALCIESTAAVVCVPL